LAAENGHEAVVRLLGFSTPWEY